MHGTRASPPSLPRSSPYLSFPEEVPGIGLWWCSGWTGDIVLACQLFERKQSAALGLPWVLHTLWKSLELVKGCAMHQELLLGHRAMPALHFAKPMFTTKSPKLRAAEGWLVRDLDEALCDFLSINPCRHPSRG